MSIPSRNSVPDSIEIGERTFFVTSKSVEGRWILQSDRMATLLIDVLRCYVAAKKFEVHEFVVMPNHLHVLLTVGKDMSIEKAVQLIKGNFSYRAKKELGWQREIWQPGFSEVRVTDRESFLAYKLYIQENPVKAGLARSPEEYPYCSTYLRAQKIKAAGRG
jgi:putative transposase